ncbi:MAG: hypothetical protein QM722_01640 [Piscinibacter sp.]
MTDDHTIPKPADERLLRYWSANMEVALASSSGAPWIGFGYEDGERERMKALAARLPGSAAVLFFAVVVVGFILLAAAAVVGGMLPVLTWLYPDPSQTRPLPFVLVLASVCLFSLGVGLPLMLGLGGWAADRFAGGTPQPSLPGDAALARKIRMQLLRMTLIMVGAFIPGCMLFILFDIQAGPLVFWLKVACGVLTLISLAGAVRARG